MHLTDNHDYFAAALLIRVSEADSIRRRRFVTRSLSTKAAPSLIMARNSNRPLNEASRALDAKMAEGAAALTPQNKQLLAANAKTLMTERSHIITVARFLSAIKDGIRVLPENKKSSEASVSFEVMSELISKHFNVAIEPRNISNFASRETKTFNNHAAFAASIFLIYHHWKAFFENGHTSSMFEELKEELNLPVIYSRLIKDSPDDFIKYLQSPQAIRLYSNFEKETTSILRITDDNINSVKTLLLGDKPSRSFVVYRETSLADKNALLCRLEIIDRNKFRDSSEKGEPDKFLHYVSYGYSEKRRGLESFGFILPLRRAIYFVGSRRDGTSLKIYAFPANYDDNRPVEGFSGLLLSAETVGDDQELFASRVYVEEKQEAVAAPALVEKRSLSEELRKSIENNIEYIIGDNVFDAVNKSVLNLTTLKYVLNSCINNCQSWGLKDKDGKNLNPLDDEVIRTTGVLTAASDWNFVRRGGDEQ